jgi:hypothetical protein
MPSLLLLVVGLSLLVGALLLFPRREPPGLIISSALGLTCVITAALAFLWLGGASATLFGRLLGFYGDGETAGLMEAIPGALMILAGAIVSVGNPRRNFGLPRRLSRRASSQQV